MFTKRRPSDPDQPQARQRDRQDGPAGRSRPGVSGAAGAYDVPRRVAEHLVPGSRHGDPRSPVQSGKSEGRKLVVGRDISLSGEINACETLIVDGQVEADLKDCEVLRISAPGLFKGTAVVDQADISGRFEGELTVRGRLVLRATGRIAGQLRYNDMEVERGGKIGGTLEELTPSTGAERVEPITA